MARPLFAEVWRGEQAVDERFVGLGRGIADEAVHVGRGGRQAGEYIGHAPDQRAAIGRLGVGQLVFRETGFEERIDRRGWRRTDLLKGPMRARELSVPVLGGRGLRRRRAPRRTTIHPGGNGVNLGIFEASALGHAKRTLVPDRLYEQAFAALAGENCGSCRAAFH